MKIRSAALMLVLASCAEPQAPEIARQGPATELAGRTAGPARLCIPLDKYQALRVSEADPHTLLYGYGKTIWVNNLGPDCSFNQGAVLVTHLFGSSYCQGDTIHALDPFSHIPGPECLLGRFTPYTR